MEDQALLLQQIEDLEKSSPRHPRLGQWKARLDKLNQLLSEITDAEERAANNMPPDRPRHELVPQDPQFEPQQPQIPAKPLPRRKSRPRGAHDPKPSSGPIQEFDATILSRADTILQELERRKVPMTIQSLAKRLGVKTHALYTCAPICDRLAQHNKQCPISRQEVIEAQLQELQTLKKTATPSEFSQQCGFSRSKLSKQYPEWQQKLKDHNRSMRDEILRDQSEQHLRELISAQVCVSLLDFARFIGVSVEFFVKRCPEIAQRVLQHNRELGLRGSINHASKEDRIAHIYKRWNEARESGRDFSLTEFAKYSSIDPDTIRTLCPELLPQLRKQGEWVKRKIDAALAQAFVEIELSGEVKTVEEFVSAAGISKSTLFQGYRQWAVRLDEHNRSMREAKLQATWTRMEHSGTVWSCEKFAEELELSLRTFQKNYPDWHKRLMAEAARHDHEVVRQLDRVLEEHRQSQAFLSLAKAAKEAGIEYKTLKRLYFLDICNRIVEYNKTTFRPIVEDALREIKVSGKCPTLVEFTHHCGLPHSYALEKYFPDVAEQLRTLERQREVNDG